jgi:hypothetical protein
VEAALEVLGKNMIKNNKQYRITKLQLKKFKRALLEISKKDSNPMLLKIAQDALKSECIIFKKDIKKYEAKKLKN